MADNLTSDDIRKIAEAAEAFSRLANEINPLTEKSEELTKQADKNSKAFKVFGKEMSDAGASLRKAMLNASDTTGKYAEGVEGATSAVSNLASNFGLLGKGVGFLINIFGKLAGGALKQNENFVKTYRQLSQFGELSRGEFKDILKDLQQSGYSIDQNSESYVRALQKVAPSLATFSGTVSEGKDKLNDVFQNSLGDAQYELERFGYTTEEAFERTGFYMSQLAASGGQRAKSDKEINAQSRIYLENLVGLSMITGQTRDEAEAKLKRDQNDLRFQMHLRKLELSGRAAEADNLRLMMDVLPDEMAEGAKSIVVNQGRIVDDFGAQIYQAIGNEGIAGIMKTVKVSSENFPVAMARMMNDHSVLLGKRFQTFETQIGIANDSAKDFGATIGYFNYKNQGEVIKADEISKRMAILRDKNQKNDMNANTERGKNERKLRNAFEQLEYEISKIVIPALNMFSDAMTSIGASFADILYSIGGPDIRDAFVTFSKLEEVTDQLVKQQQRQVQLNKDREATEKELNELLKKQKEAEERQKRGGIGAMAGSKPQDFAKDIENLRFKLSGITHDIQRSQGIQSKARTAGSEMYGSTGTAETTQGANLLQGLKIKKGDVQKEGAYLDPKLIELANKIQGNVGGFSYFSSFNDQYHQDKSSLHNKGKALDFVLNHWPTIEEGKKITELLKSYGATGVKDEYNFPSSNATAGHIHAELQGKTQGIFKGPESGYWLKAHGEEALLNQQGLSNLVTKMQMPNMNGNNMDIVKVLQDGISELINEISDLVELQRVSNRTQDELLTYAKN